MTRKSVIVLIVTLLCGFVRADEPEADKMSNDRPDRPLQMPPVSSETKEAFDDFERFARRGAWERATKALYTIPETQAARFVDGPNGFIVSVAHKRRAVLAGLSPEGQSAYRLFYDADAKKLLDQAEGPAEQATLERLYSSYFLTSVGDNAGDRLGDLYFEQGQFDRAADCWLAILRERPDSELSPALIAVKSMLALARAGRRSELEALRTEANERYADETVTIGGRKAKVAEHLKRLLKDLEPSREAAASSSSGNGGPAPDLAETVPAVWQVRFGDSVTAGMTPAELAQWETTALSGAVPAVAIEGQTLFANYLGHVFAVDLNTGKLLWRSASFHNLEQAAMQGSFPMIDTRRFAILAQKGLVWSLGRDVKDPNFQAEFRLVCRRAENGDVIWESSDLPDHAGMDFVGPPILARGTLFVTGKSSMAAPGGQDNQPRQFVLAIRPHDGKVLWKAEVGIFREGERYYYYGMRESSPQPRLLHRAGSLYVDTQNGVFARLDAESGTVDWGYGYPTDPVQTQGRVIFFNGMMEPASTPAASSPTEVGGAVLIKGAKSDHLCAIDPDRMKVLWDRPIAKSTRLIGADEGTLYLGGPELGALDLRTRSLRWSTPLPGGSNDGRLLVRPDSLWQLTPRGIFEVDTRTGRVRRIFRGQETGAEGGDLILTDRWLLATSNRTISAYPLSSSGSERITRKSDGGKQNGGRND